MHPTRHLALAAALATLACAEPAPTVTEADLEAIRAGRAAFREGMLAANYSAVGALYAENAVVLPPNAPLTRGRMEVERLLSGFPPVGEFAFSDAELTPLGGDAVLVTGRYTLLLMPPGSTVAVADTGKYVEVWRRDDAGWKIHWDAWNSDIPLPPPPPPPAGGR